MFDEDVNALHAWMANIGRTDDKAAFWMHKFIILRGEMPMSALGDMSSGIWDDGGGSCL